MFSIASRLGPRRVGVTLGGLAVVAALALPGSAWADQHDTSTKTINGTVTQIVGDATGGGVAGPAVAINTPLVIQQNIQVDTTNNANNNQTATNTATVNQDTAAGSGDAAGSDGGAATSGAAVATSTAVILQLNIQIITGFVPAAGISQTASNDATVGQTTVAGSGGADATGTGSSASSGTATASNNAYIGQINIQMYTGSYGGADTTGAVSQTAANGASADQTTVGASGTATASDGGQSTTGNAAAQAQHTINQLFWQFNY